MNRCVEVIVADVMNKKWWSRFLSALFLSKKDVILIKNTNVNNIRHQLAKNSINIENTVERRRSKPQKNACIL